MTAAINVNLDAHHTTCSGNIHADDSCKPILIPCPIPRSVTFEVRSGECSALCSNALSSGGTRHRNDCPARPIRVTCDISRKTWAQSEVVQDSIEVRDAAGRTFGLPDVARLLVVIGERWALVKALVLGQDPPRDAASVREAGDWIEMFSRRNAVFSALADMARAEDAAFEAQRRLVAACHVLFNSSEPYHESDSRNRPSTRFMAHYVERLIEQVGVLP